MLSSKRERKLQEKNEIGIEKGYPRIRRRFGKLASYIQLLRPFTLLAPLVAGLLGVLAPVEEITFSHITTAIYVGITLALLQAAGQVLNQWSDFEIDKLARPYRPLPLGVISRDEALGLAWLLSIFAIGRAFTVSITFGLYALILLFFSVFYSLAPFSPRRVNPILNVMWMAISRGFIPFLAVLTVYGTFEYAIKWAVFGFLWVLAYQSSKDIHDVEADRSFGIKTIPNTYGIQALRVHMIIITVVIWFYAIVYLPMVLWLTPISILALVGLNRKVDGLENDLSWVSFYLGLGISYLILFIAN